MQKQQNDAAPTSERELTLTFAICYRPSVCLSSVTFVRRTQAIEIFGNVSMLFGTLAICETLPKISIARVGCTNVTDDRQTDGRTIAYYSERKRVFHVR